MTHKFEEYKIFRQLHEVNLRYNAKKLKHYIKVCISTMHINENLIVSSAYMNV